MFRNSFLEDGCRVALPMREHSLGCTKVRPICVLSEATPSGYDVPGPMPEW